MATIGYARVSTTGQSLSAQTDQLEEHGIDKLFKEKVSGIKQDRPQLAALLDYVREGDSVVVTKIDRIARSTKHLLEIVDTLKDEGVGFRILNIDFDIDTATGRMMLTMLSGIATFERELMLERQAEGIAIAKAQGRYKGRKPTARAKSAEVVSLAGEGLTRQAIANQLEIGIASVYRILKANNEPVNTSK